MPGISWTDEMNTRLREMWEGANLSATLIGERLGMSKSAIIGRAHRLGLSRRPNAAVDNPYTPEEDAKIRELRALGYGKTAIAYHIGRSPQSVSERARRIGAQYAPQKRALPTLSAVPMPPRRVHRARPPVPRVIASPPPRPETPRPVRVSGLCCCWPFGDPGTKEFRYCDSPDVVTGRPYCLAHMEIAYQFWNRPKGLAA